MKRLLAFGTFAFLAGAVVSEFVIPFARRLHHRELAPPTAGPGRRPTNSGPVVEVERGPVSECLASRSPRLTDRGRQLLAALEQKVFGRGGLLKLGRVAIDGDWSPTGEYVIFIAGKGLQLVNTEALLGTDLLGLGTTSGRVLIQDTRVRGPRFSPDGRAIAYYILGQQGVWLLDLDSNQPRQLSVKGGAFLEWSPDGRYIVSVGEATAPVSLPLFLTETATGSTMESYLGAWPGGYEYPGGSETGEYCWGSNTTLLFRLRGELGCFDLGGVRRWSTSFPFPKRSCFKVQVSPNGEALACASGDGEMAVFVKEIHSGISRKVGTGCKARWSPDSRLLIGDTWGCGNWMKGTESSMGLWIMPATRELTQEAYEAAILKNELPALSWLSQ